jgi:hypothetical protein
LAIDVLTSFDVFSCILYTKKRPHGDIWKVAQTPEEAVQLLYETPVWDISIRKFAAI